MALIVKYHTFTDYDADIVPSHISAERLNTNFDRLYTLVNGNLDNANSATDLFFTESQATQSSWVSTDEGRFIYTQDTEKIYYGDSDEWIEVGTGGTPEAHNILSASHGDTVAASGVAGDLIYANATPKWTKLAKGSDGEFLTLTSGLPAWSATPSSLSHILLHTTHTDTVAASAVAGDLLYANATPAWTKLAKGTDGQFLTLSSGVPTWSATPVAGDILYGNATPVWTKLAKGTDGEVLVLQSGIPDWVGGAGNEGEVLTFESGVPTWSSTAAASTSFLLLSDTPANYTSDAKKVLVVNEAGNAVTFASTMKWNETGDALEIGGAGVGAPLYVTRSTSQTTGPFWSSGNFKHKTSGNMADNFGASIFFFIEDNAASEPIALLGAVRAGADDTGNLIFRTYRAGNQSERMRIDHYGNVIIGTQQEKAIPGAMCLVLGNGTAPTSSMNAAPILYSDPITVGSNIYCVNIRNTDGTILKLQQESHIPDATSSCPDIGTVLLVVNGILSILQANGLMAAS